MKKGTLKALVIGYGSIGARHARILRRLRVPSAVVSSRAIDFKPSYRRLSEALKRERPNYVVAANRTSERLRLLKDLQSKGFKGIVLAEKPLFAGVSGHSFRKFKGLYVGYNLRFHPVLQKLKQLLSKEKVLSVQCYVGKYLPTWRRADYRRSYSADRAKGGGVLRDLSHELDYLLWMLGPWKRLTATGGHYSSLQIDSDDAYALMVEFKRCPLVTLQMNYLDRVPKREILAVTDKNSFKADLVNGTLAVNGKTQRFATSPDLTYRLEHEAILKGDFKALCSYREGAEVLRMIEAAEKAAKRKVWVS